MHRNWDTTKYMNSLTSGSSSFGSDQEDDDKMTANPGDQKEEKWEVVTKTAGLVPAQIIAQRLEFEGIPARAWQEGAGQALGLTVGLLGNGYVMVPESHLDEAKAILASSEQFDESGDDDLFDEESEAG